MSTADGISNPTTILRFRQVDPAFFALCMDEMTVLLGDTKLKITLYYVNHTLYHVTHELCCCLLLWGLTLSVFVIITIESVSVCRV